MTCRGAAGHARARYRQIPVLNLVRRVVRRLSPILRRDDGQIMCSTTTTNCDVLRHGAATDLMEEVGGALTARGIALMLGERPMWWSSEKDAGTKSALNQVRGKEERGLLQHSTPTSRAGRGASGGCDQGLLCCKKSWSYGARGRRGGVEKPGSVAGWATSTSPRRLVRAASSPTKVPRWPQAAAKCNAHLCARLGQQ